MDLACMLFFSIKKMKIIKHPLLVIILVLSSCSSVPDLRTFLVGDGVLQYFIPPTEWTVIDSKDSKSKLDVTCRTGPDVTAPATVNISFYGKNEMPKNVSSAALHGAGVDCQLENISIILVNNERKEYRITTQADRDKFFAVLNAEPVTLTAEVDGVSYTYTPHKYFIKLKDQFLSEISIQY